MQDRDAASGVVLFAVQERDYWEKGEEGVSAADLRVANFLVSVIE